MFTKLKPLRIIKKPVKGNQYVFESQYLSPVYLFLFYSILLLQKGKKKKLFLFNFSKLRKKKKNHRTVIEKEKQQMR